MRALARLEGCCSAPYLQPSFEARRRRRAPQDDVSTVGCARRANHLRARNPVQPLREKYSALFLTQITFVLRASHPTRGALRTSRNARWDAVDAKFAKDDRKRSRTAKPCGPDAPMAGVKFARSSRFLGMTVTNKLWSHRGEHGISRKPSRREGRMSPLNLYARVRFFSYFCTRDRGCSAHPVFPAPSLEGRLRPLFFGGR